MSESKINKSLLSFPVLFQSVDEIGNEDCRFTRVKIWLMHLGENFNGSYFEKEVIDEAIPTLQYIPIVAFIEDNHEGEKDCSDHRYIITKNENGICRKYKGVAYGVIVSSADNNAHYEERLCDDGKTRTFLVVDGLLWNMFEDSSEIMNRDIIKSQSVELWDDEESFDGYEDENGIFHFTKFSFRASCILGKDYEPAMINSTVEVQFTMNDFIRDIQSELNDRFIAFTKLMNTKNNKGGIVMPKTNFSQTVMEQFKDISGIVRNYETIKDRWGDEYPRYYLVDIQDNEVIVVDRKSDYHNYGFPFVLNGDKAEIDFACGGNRKKIRYENYEDGSSELPEGSFDFGKHIKELENIAYQKVKDAENKLIIAEKAKETAETNYSQIKANYDDIKPKYDEFVKTENKRLASELESRKDAEFKKYETVLADNLEFVALKEKKSEMSIDDIISECAILYAKKNLGTSTDFSKSNNNHVVAGIIDEDVSDGYVPTKYGNIPVRR